MERLFGPFVAFLLIGAGALGLLTQEPSFDNPFEGSPDVEATMSASTDDQSEEPSGDTDDESESCDQRRGVIDAVKTMGFDREDFVVGASAVDWSILPNTHTDRSFSPVPLRSWQQVSDFLLGDTKKSSVLDGVTDDGTINPLEDGRWIAVQFQVPTRYDGNNYWDGQTDITGGPERAPAGDVWWFNVEHSGCGVNPTDSLRAACGNPGFYHLKPVRKD